MNSHIKYLFHNRLKVKVLSFFWFKVWLKRLYNLKGLIKILIRVHTLSIKGSKIGSLSVIGKHVLNGKARNLIIGEESVLGNNIQLMLHDKIKVGNRVVISDGCILLTGSHGVNQPDWPLITAPIVIHDYAWIATNVIIMPGVTIGYGAVVAAGAVVSRDILPYHVVGGNPAKKIKQRILTTFTHNPVHFLAPFEAWLGLKK